MFFQNKNAWTLWRPCRPDASPTITTRWAPFVVGETVVTVDHAWWAGLTEAARADISALGEVVSGPVDRPHPAQDSDRFWAVYRAHNRQYEHQRWHPGVAEWMAGRGDLLTLVVLDQFALEWLEAGGSPPVPLGWPGCCRRPWPPIIPHL